MRKPVLTIFYQFNPWCNSIGGIQTVIRSFIKYAPDEFEVRLVGTGLPGDAVGEWQTAELDGKLLHFMPLLALQDDNVRQWVPTTLRYTGALLRRQLASDFMHFHRIEPGLAALKWAGDKTLFIHNDIEKQINPATGNNAILWQRFPAGYLALERLLVKQFTQILSCNTESMRFYQRRYPEVANRMAYFRNTVDTEIFYPLSAPERETQRQTLARQMQLSEQTRFVLFAGRLHPQKNPILLIQSIAALEDPTIHLLIAGEGELSGEIRAEIERLGLTKQVTMLGIMAQQELAQIHRVCHAFVLTSVYEGLPLVVLEALSCGTPIVTTNCGETPRLLAADSGRVCHESTPEAIASALREVVLHPERYPAEACIRNAAPYSARSVVNEVYTAMLERWHLQQAA